MKLISYKKFADWFLCLPSSWRVHTSIQRYVQVWIIAMRWKQSAVGWFLESIQKTWSS